MLRQKVRHFDDIIDGVSDYVIYGSSYCSIVRYYSLRMFGIYCARSRDRRHAHRGTTTWCVKSWKCSDRDEIRYGYARNDGDAHFAWKWRYHTANCVERSWDMARIDGDDDSHRFESLACVTATYSLAVQFFISASFRTEKNLYNWANIKTFFLLIFFVFAYCIC